MSKPSDKLLRRVGLYRTTFGAGANIRWNDELVAQFAEQIVRECSKIADEFGCDVVEAAILRKFGLKE